MAERWAVVGGGMSGLFTALRLSDAGHTVVVYEAAPVVGGLASAWKLGDISWDRHYHVTLASDTALRSLLQELGLDTDMEWVGTKTGAFANGTMYSWSDTIDFIKYPPLNLVSKARLAATILYASRVKNWRKLEQVPVETWLRKWSGNRTFDRFWLPLLKAKLSDNYRNASAAFIWATIQRLNQARRTGLKREEFGYVRGGYARILDRFVEHLTERGVDVRTGTRVERITSSGTPTVTADGADETFDGVIVTVASPIAATLIDGMDPALHQRLSDVSYQGIVCASLLLKRRLGDYYLTYITDDLPFTAVVDMSAFVLPDDLGDHGLVYLPKYIEPSDDLLRASDEEIRASFLEGLRVMYPDLVDSDVLAFEVSRVRYVFPVPTIGYSAVAPSVETGLPGVYTITSAHIINGTLNVNESIESVARGLTRVVSTEGVRQRT